MTDRTEQLRRLSLDTPPSITGERAKLVTEFYQAHDGKFSVPVMRARNFLHLCEHKTIYLGDGELIVGERGPAPKLVPTFPELTCHSAEDLRILNSRPKTWYRVSDECIRLYEEKVIPYWRGRSMRDRMFAFWNRGFAWYTSQTDSTTSCTAWRNSGCEGLRAATESRNSFCVMIGNLRQQVVLVPGGRAGWCRTGHDPRPPAQRSGSGTYATGMGKSRKPRPQRASRISPVRVGLW